MSHTQSHKKILTCADIYEDLCDNLDENIDSESCRRIKAHIEGCKNCSALLDSLKKTIYLYREYPTPKLPSKAKTELFALMNIPDKPTKKIPHR